MPLLNLFKGTLVCFPENKYPRVSYIFLGVSNKTIFTNHVYSQLITHKSNLNSSL